MEYRVIGKTGIKVSPLCFGTMSFGGNADEQTSRSMFRRCRDRGINFFDTADVYSAGRSEEILGACISGCRNEIILTTKVFFPTGEDINARGLSRRHIMEALEASLGRLKTDRVEFYFVHSFDQNTPMEETLRALDDLRRQGKILHTGVSNWAAWQIAKSLGISAREGLARFELIQPMYNLVKRQAEVEILPLAKSEQLGVIPYSPTGAGLLTGKYGVNKKPESGRIVEDARYKDRYRDEKNYIAADRFTALAEKRGVHPAALAIAWVMAHPAVTAPITGARNTAQLEDNLGALDIEMDEELREAISACSEAPPPATDRTEIQLPNWK